MQNEFARIYRQSGIQQEIEQAMAGWLQHLVGQFVIPMITPPAPMYVPSPDPYTVVGVSPGDPPDMVDAVYRAKAKFLHPDNPTSGNTEAFVRLQQSYLQIKEYRSNGTAPSH